MILDTVMGSNEVDCGESDMARDDFSEEPIAGRTQLKRESSDFEICPKEQQCVRRVSISDEQSESSSKASYEGHDPENNASDRKFCRGSDSADKEAYNYIGSGEKDVTGLTKHSSAFEPSGLKEESSSSSDSRAPIGSIGVERSSLLGSHPIALSRSNTFKESPKPDLKLDRLSEREKEKLIANIVKLQQDGTVEVDLEKGAPVASDLLEQLHSGSVSIEDSPEELIKSIPRLRIAMLVVGTRGDVQPFLAVAKRLQEFGHHVRLATHINFEDFVKSAGVEFYPLGGDPRILAKYLVKNKGLFPSGPEDIKIQRKQVRAVIESLLPACTEPDKKTGAAFRAQAIIANPPAYGHAHVAEALGVPLHIFFTMPWTPTCEFPHPFARVPHAGYWLSYIIVDLFIWWGIRSYINGFRRRILKLAPIPYFSMYHSSISHLPTGYMWSPHVVPKPTDWGPLVDVVGYCFLNLRSTYEPQEEFVQWIQKGPKPIYIGFGSMLLDNAQETTRIIMEALNVTGQRGILDRGWWGDLGKVSDVPENIFLLDNCPHDWLFPQCYAVVHHGGAGTTATGLKAGCPTTVVPFFGDQFFWADRIYEKRLGPEPIPINDLSVETLSNAVRFMLHPEVKSRAMEIANLIANEDGVAAAVDAFHRHLPPELPLLVPTKDDDPDILQQFFAQIGSLCCLACS